MPKIKVLTIQFSNEISTSEIPQFRGAVIASLNEKDPLFHNHTDEGLIYRYPRIQYKRIHGKAAIVCVKEGVEAIYELFTSQSLTYHIGDRQVEMKLESIHADDREIDFCDTPQPYRLRNWLPLNSENYHTYQNMEDFADKVHFLEGKLVGNLLSFFKYIDFITTDRIELRITNITAQRTISYKKVKMMAFDIEFKVNLNLPQYIGIGKSASTGFGVLSRIKNHSPED